MTNYVWNLEAHPGLKKGVNFDGIGQNETAGTLSLSPSLSLSVHLCPAPTSSPKELQSLESTAVSA
jgi:hypothetical protein